MAGENDSHPRFFIRYQIDRVDYALTEDELTQMEQVSQNIYKDFFFPVLFLGIPCLLNMFGYVKDPFEWSYGLFFNFCIGLICILSSLVLGLGWRRTHGAFTELVNKIKAKPKIEIQVLPVTGSTSTTSSVETNNKPVSA
jgi:hypothetical protein